MSDWKPIGVHLGGPPSQAPVRIATVGRYQILLYLSADIMERMGNPEHAVPMLNGNPCLLGLRAAEPVRGETLQLTRSTKRTSRLSSRGTAAVSCRTSIKGTLEAMGKALEPMASVPHRWDGDVLVIDLSGLPDATGAR